MPFHEKVRFFVISSTGTKLNLLKETIPLKEDGKFKQFSSNITA